MPILFWNLNMKRYWTFRYTNSDNLEKYFVREKLSDFPWVSVVSDKTEMRISITLLFPNAVICYPLIIYPAFLEIVFFWMLYSDLFGRTQTTNLKYPLNNISCLLLPSIRPCGVSTCELK